MSKLYGFKEQDVLALAQFLNTKKHLSLSCAFEEFGRLNSKATGTIRNLYYAVAKKSKEDKEFCKKYFNGQTLHTHDILEFYPCQTHALVKQIIKKTILGKSVRSAIKEIARGDSALATRYQNKFRNQQKLYPEMVESVKKQVMKEMGIKQGGVLLNLTKDKDAIIIRKLKSDINALFDKSFLSLKTENLTLRKKVECLQRQNDRLTSSLYQERSTKKVYKYFEKNNSQTLPS